MRVLCAHGLALEPTSLAAPITGWVVGHGTPHSINGRCKLAHKSSYQQAHTKRGPIASLATLLVNHIKCQGRHARNEMGPSRAIARCLQVGGCGNHPCGPQWISLVAKSRAPDGSSKFVKHTTQCQHPSHERAITCAALFALGHETSNQQMGTMPTITQDAWMCDRLRCIFALGHETSNHESEVRTHVEDACCPPRVLGS